MILQRLEYRVIKQENVDNTILIISKRQLSKTKHRSIVQTVSYEGLA